MQKFQNNIQDQFGNEVNGATITVRNVVGGALSSIFSDDGVTPLANPFIAQDFSEFFFYAANSRYDIFITGPVTDTFLDVLLFDSVGTISVIPTISGSTLRGAGGTYVENRQLQTNGQTVLGFNVAETIHYEISHDDTHMTISQVGGLTALRVLIGAVMIDELSAAPADLAGSGQFWVRDDVPNTPMFTDDAGNDFVLNAAGNLQAVVAAGNTTTNDIEIITGAALTIFDAADVDSVSMEINTTTMAPAEAFVFLESANIEVYSFNEPINIDFGSLHVGGIGTGIEFWRFGDSVSHSISKEIDGVQIQVVAGILRVQADALAMHEVASAPVDVAGGGQWWVRDDVPNTPMFTDDLGNDFELNAGSGGNVTKVGTPVDNQIGVWTGDDTIEGDSDLTWTGTVLEVGGTIQVSNASGSALLNEVSSNTNPTVIANLGDLTSGLGGIAGQPSLIAGGLSCMSVSAVGAVRRVGFYDGSPIALQTGVPVTTSAVHAALVALRLITA